MSTTRDWITEALADQRPPLRPAGWPTHRRRARRRKSARIKAARARRKLRRRGITPEDDR